jgi:hypothetical protein
MSKKQRKRVVYMDELDERIYDLERKVLDHCFRVHGLSSVSRASAYAGTIQDVVQTLERLTILRETQYDD